ncbi:hypothetical protein SynMINOS11_00204 [Synechococcus sp. Minos11]|uniref:hypothetical protein n=1 Tax=Synechococcus sp. Minos11 TaxID=221341 RepID=UPI00164886C5|nr:hypothetical protein [Synechococcus sp. Minos11]QNJ07691.1 hypothetical protein SynMINOS11_00204 [Synechococcus sp. Minos11]
MKRSVAYIVCDHGLGHLRRVLLLLHNNSFFPPDTHITLFAPLTCYQKLITSLSLPSFCSIQLIDFHTSTSLANFSVKSLNPSNWLSNLPSLQSFSSVYSDNLVDILSVRPDACITAQFFWHTIARDLNPYYFEYCTSLLQRHNPQIYGYELFSMPDVKSQSGFCPIPLAFNPALLSSHQSRSFHNRNNLLITGGSTPILQSSLKSIMTTLLYKGPFPFSTIYVDPPLLSDMHPLPSWLKPASFSIDMFCSLRAAICRPGLGILTDLISLGVKPFLLHERNNLEMLHNSSVMTSNNLSTQVFPFPWQFSQYSNL